MSEPWVPEKAEPAPNGPAPSLYTLVLVNADGVKRHVPVFARSLDEAVGQAAWERFPDETLIGIAEGGQLP